MSKQFTSPIRVSIVEDHNAYREVVSDIIDNAQGFCITGNYSSLEEITDEIFESDVVLMDIGLPGKSGIEGLKEIKHYSDSIRVIILTNYLDDDKIFEAIAAGADGYLLKKVSTTRILDAISDTLQGGASMTPLIARRVLQAFKFPQSSKQIRAHLSKREKEILALLVQGMNYKSAAEHLCISPETVRNHIRNIYKKLQIHTRSEAVAKAIREGLI